MRTKKGSKREGAMKAVAKLGMTKERLRIAEDERNYAIKKSGNYLSEKS